MGDILEKEPKTVFTHKLTQSSNFSKRNRLYLIIGFIFVLFDLRINGFDIILPDFLGYIFVFLALRPLETVNRSFYNAGRLSFLQIFISLPDFFNFPNLVSGSLQLFTLGGFIFNIDFLPHVFIITSFFDGLFIWYLFGGLITITREIDPSVAYRVSQTNVIYISYYFFAWFLTPGYLLFPLPDVITLILYPTLVILKIIILFGTISRLNQGFQTFTLSTGD
jgi:hypothetical protein